MNHTMNDRPCSACGDLDGCHMPAKIRDNRLSLEEFWHYHAEWSQATFGTDSERGPAGPLKHLAKEVQEALEQVEAVRLNMNNPGVKAELGCLLEEFGDCLVLIFDATRRVGFTYEDLRLAVNVKLAKNKRRVWPKPSTNDEPVEHDRSKE